MRCEACIRIVFGTTLYAFEDWFGVTGILYAGGTLFGLLALLSFLDSTPLRRRPVVAVLGGAALAGDSRSLNHGCRRTGGQAHGLAQTVEPVLK